MAWRILDVCDLGCPSRRGPCAVSRLAAPARATPARTLATVLADWKYVDLHLCLPGLGDIPLARFCRPSDDNRPIWRLDIAISASVADIRAADVCAPPDPRRVVPV